MAVEFLPLENSMSVIRSTHDVRSKRWQKSELMTWLGSDGTNCSNYGSLWSRIFRYLPWFARYLTTTLRDRKWFECIGSADENHNEVRICLQQESWASVACTFLLWSYALYYWSRKKILRRSATWDCICLHVCSMYVSDAWSTDATTRSTPKRPSG